MKFLHAAFVAPALFQRSDVKLSQSALLSSVSNFNVGGNKFTIHDEDVRKHPTSLLLQLAESASIEAGVKDEIEIDRSGALFKYVYAFLVNGQLPRNGDGYITLDEKTLAELQVEADFYGLQALSDDCKIHQKKLPDLGSYMTIRKYLKDYRRSGIELQRNSMLGRVVRSFCSPFCVKGSLYTYSWHRHSLFKSTTASKVNVEELVAFATQSPFGRGTETIVDTSVRNSFEIDGSQLNVGALADIREECNFKDLAPHLDLIVRPYKLVIYKEGGHFDAHRDTVRGDGHIGTLVVILNSEYTGGELEVTHGGRTEVVTGPYSWVAMYGDCLHKINPVTSGTRVSLIYDIYGTPPTKGAGVADKKVGSASALGADFKPASVRDEEKKKILRECLSNELEDYDSIILCLEHLYPECQANPSFLKGADRTLHDFLMESGEYEVQVVAATIYTYDYEGDDYPKYTGCGLFSPSLVQRALEDDPTEEPHEKIKLVMSGDLDDNALLDYTPYAEHTGNEAQAEEKCYIVAGLQVRKKKKM